jgi:hypothetical protein
MDVDVGPSLTAVLVGVGGRGLGDESAEPHAEIARESPSARVNSLAFCNSGLNVRSGVFECARLDVGAAGILAVLMLSVPLGRTTQEG